MKAIVLNRFGGPENLELVDDYPLPPIGKDQLRIKVKATSFNLIDFKLREGLKSSKLPVILGSDFAGVVTELGPGVSDYRIDDEVYGISLGSASSHGSYCEYVTVSKYLVSKKPAHLNFAEAAAIVLAGVIALECLVRRANLQPNHTVLITAVGGGVSSLSIQIAKYIGANVIVSAPDEKYKQILVRELGLPKERVLVTTSSSSELQNQIRALSNNQPIDVFLDLQGGESIREAATQLIGENSKVIRAVEELEPEQGTYNKVSLSELVESAGKEGDPIIQQLIDQITNLFESHHLITPKVEVLGLFSLDTVQRAHSDLHLQYKDNFKFVMKMC